jgi:thiol-disulfide isomerase/thioredoxin
MKRIATAFVGLGAVALAFAVFAQAVSAADAPAKTVASTKAATSVKPPADRIVVMYFHRTQRCPTCLKMGGYSEEAVKKGFAKEIKKGKVEFHFIDFQDEKNEALTKGYDIGGPTLIVAKVVNNKVKDRKNLTEVWTKVRDKDAFIEYVQSNVKDYQK